MNITRDNDHLDRRSPMLWIAALLVLLLTFFMLDAAALAWSASLISARQALADLLTFFAVAGGLALTVWKLYTAA